MAAEPIPHEMLLTHAGFLRRLARDLVGDPAAADDAVQEVWLRALEKPPRHGSNVRGWLRVVLTNLVRTRARDDSRRTARELDHGPSPSSEQQSTLRSVTEAVLALDEPLRTTVLQHYFQGLTTTEIAQRENLPAPTVKSRLQRALEVLRVRLRRENGDSWHASLLALTVPAKVGKGVILMSLKMKLAIGAAGLLCVALAYRGLSGPSDTGGDSAASLLPVAKSESAPEAGTGKSPLDSAPSAGERAAGVALEGGSSVAANELPETLFYGTLRDPAGKPLAGLWSASVGATNSEGRRRNAEAKDSGTYAFSALPYGKYWISVYADGFRSAMETIELDAAHAQLRKDFTLQPMPIVKVRVTTPDGKSLFGEEREEMKLKGDPVLVPVATRERPGKWFNEVTGSLNNPFGIGHFWQFGPRAEALPKGYMGLLMLDQELPAYVSLLNYHRVLQTKELQPGEYEVNFVISLDDLSASMGTLRMQVVDAGTQAPLQGASAELTGGPRGGMDGTSGADGNILVEDHEPGEFDLRVYLKGYEQYRARVLVDSGTTTDLGQLALEKEIPVAIKVVDTSGAPRNAQFSLGIYDPSTQSVRMDERMLYASRGEGVLTLSGLGRHIYVLHTRNLDAVNDQVLEDPKWVAGNLLLDLRSGVAPSLVVITLVPATRVMLSVKDGSADALRFRISDEQGFEVMTKRFWGEAPRPLSLPQGAYKLALLDANNRVLHEQALVVGAKSTTAELAR